MTLPYQIRARQEIRAALLGARLDLVEEILAATTAQEASEYQAEIDYLDRTLAELQSARFEPLAPPEPEPPRAGPVFFVAMCLAISAAVVIAAIWRV
jgi:hypothetical protein